jgi:hypothetical protein
MTKDRGASSTAKCKTRQQQRHNMQDSAAQQQVRLDLYCKLHKPASEPASKQLPPLYARKYLCGHTDCKRKQASKGPCSTTQPCVPTHLQRRYGQLVLGPYRHIQPHQAPLVQLPYRGTVQVRVAGAARPCRNVAHLCERQCVAGRVVKHWRGITQSRHASWRLLSTGTQLQLPMNQSAKHTWLRCLASRPTSPVCIAILWLPNSRTLAAASPPQQHLSARLPASPWLQLDPAAGTRSHPG